MSTIYGTDGLGPATSMRQVYSPLEAYWIAFQEWRNCESRRTVGSPDGQRPCGHWYYAR